MRYFTLLTFTCAFSSGVCFAESLEAKIGQAGPSGWRCHVIQLDPNDNGPDGFNDHDWDGDGDLDVLVNFEEGGFSRLYFNPGKAIVRKPWKDFIEFSDHGKCEDSTIGDLDGDGDLDYVANGGHVFFNPGLQELRDPSKWIRMSLFKKEARVPVVYDLDGDGLNDLIIGAQAWYKQPTVGKHEASNWVRYELGEASWPMTCIVTDMDGDGDDDILVQERRKQGTFYYVNMGKEKITERWPVEIIDPKTGGMFLALGDLNGDQLPDLVRAAANVDIFLRKNAKGVPEYQKVEVKRPEQPASVSVKPKPKGVAILEINGDRSRPEIVIIPEYAAQLWYVELSAEKWTSKLLDIPFPESRKKMDNAYLSDLDGDGDLDIATTEENGGWGVIWFENPANN